MILKPATFLLTALFLFLQGGWAGAQDEIARDLVRRFSIKWTQTNHEILDIDRQLAALPDMPVENLQGTGGLLAFCPAPTKANPNPELTIEVTWKKPRMIDLISLFPARNYDAKGLQPEFGLPESFTIDLLDGSGKAIHRIADEPKANARRVRKGHPFVYSMAEPVEAKGARIVCKGFDRRMFFGGLVPTAAFSELLCFSGRYNIAERGTVKVKGAMGIPHHWHWKNSFLVDGFTPLGLPEVPDEPQRHVGWLSTARQLSDSQVWVSIDLGETKKIDGIRMFPLRQMSLESSPGIGLPQKMNVLASPDSSTPLQQIFEYTADSKPDPGQNPVTLRFPATEARRIQLFATKLWKKYPEYPAFLGFSEIQILRGESNLAEGAVSTSNDMIGEVVAHGDLLWSEESLTNGYGPQGKLVPQRVWVDLLGKRYQLEERRLVLEGKSQAIIASWSQTILRGLIILAVVSVILVLILPVYFKIREQRKLLLTRRRIAGDLHDEVGSNLGSIQILAELAQEKSAGVEEMPVIRRIAAETVTAVRDIVWLLRPSAGLKVGLVEHLRESATIMLEPRHWTFDTDGVEDSIALDTEAQRNLLLFYREALHNLVRHAEATNIEIRLERDGDMLILSITDDGVGISQEKLEKGATLRALKLRAKHLNADLKTVSIPGGGTRLQLSIPLHFSKNGNGKTRKHRVRSYPWTSPSPLS